MDCIIPSLLQVIILSGSSNAQTGTWATFYVVAALSLWALRPPGLLCPEFSPRTTVRKLVKSNAPGTNAFQVQS